MPISILFPPDGSAAKPIHLPRRFVAVGTRDSANQQVLGVLLSHDGKHRIGGQTLKHGGENDEEPTKWAIHFRVPRGIRRNKRFKLVVFNSGDLPGNLSAQTTYRRDYLYFRNDPRTRVADRRERAGGSDSEGQPPGVHMIRIVEVPLSGPNGTVLRTDFFAYGICPAGNNDIDTTEAGTEIVNADNEAQSYRPSWSFPGEDGFWAAFFPAIDPAIPKVHLTVVYTPNGDEEGVRDIALYPPPPTSPPPPPPPPI